MSSGGAGKGGGAAAAVKGLRLLTLARSQEGFGFHMYTNREREGQYVKSVGINSIADLAGMLTGDHVLAVDSVSVIGETHHQVVERIRIGNNEKKVLVIDMETEDEMKSRGEEINPDDAIVMIPQVAPPPPPPAPEPEPPKEELPDLEITSLDAARKNMQGRRAKEMIKTRGWKESVEAYNQL